MNETYFNIAIKFMLIFMFAATSEVALRKRRYGIALFTFSLYASIIRRLLIQMTVTPVGGWLTVPESTLEEFMTFLQSPGVVNVTDFIQLVGAIILFHWLNTVHKCPKGGEKR